MGIKKIARPMNKAKNKFLAWLKKNNANNIEDYGAGEEGVEWDYYRHISAFVENNLYIVYFQVWEGKEIIDYSDENNKYSNLSIDAFLDMIN